MCVCIHIDWSVWVPDLCSTRRVPELGHIAQLLPNRRPCQCCQRVNDLVLADILSHPALSWEVRGSDITAILLSV